MSEELNTPVFNFTPGGSNVEGTSPSDIDTSPTPTSIYKMLCDLEPECESEDELYSRNGDNLPANISNPEEGGVNEIDEGAEDGPDPDQRGKANEYEQEEEECPDPKALGSRQLRRSNNSSTSVSKTKESNNFTKQKFTKGEEEELKNIKDRLMDWFTDEHGHRMKLVVKDIDVLAKTDTEFKNLWNRYATLTRSKNPVDSFRHLPEFCSREKSQGRLYDRLGAVPKVAKYTIPIDTVGNAGSPIPNIKWIGLGPSHEYFESALKGKSDLKMEDVVQIAHQNETFRQKWMELLSHKSTDHSALYAVNSMLQRTRVTASVSQKIREEYPEGLSASLKNILNVCKDNARFKEAWQILLEECDGDEKKAKEKVRGNLQSYRKIVRAAGKESV